MLFSQLLLDGTCMKTSKGGAQSTHRLLSNGNFEELTRFRWRLINHSNVNKWINDDQVTVNEGFSFESLMHVSKEIPENVPTRLRRETQGRIKASVANTISL